MKVDFTEFWRRFGGSSRRKHLHGIIPGSAELKHREDHENKRRFVLPATSELPVDFIRMEPWEIEYLFMLATLASKGALEIGRFNGGSAFVMACANDRVPIFSIDIAPVDDQLLKSYFDKCNVGRNVQLIVADSQQMPDDQIGPVDLCYVDGDHSFDGSTADLESSLQRLGPGGHILVHDCYLGSPVQKAVIDFVGRHDVGVVLSPFQGHSHWLTDHGSLAHLVKR